MKIYVLGDTHGYWNLLNNFINKNQPDIIFQCGDFGYWPAFPEFSLNKIKNKDTVIYWCPGNHESWIDLNLLKSNEVHPKIFYMKRGSTFLLPDGRRVLFMGGARSVDKHLRTPGYDWFPEEDISQKDLQDLPDEKIDIVISHTCPMEFPVESKYDIRRMKDSNRQALSIILKKYQPKLWYFGHWHYYTSGFTNNCKWYCLDQIPEGKYYLELEE